MKKTVMSLFAVCVLSIFCAAQDVQVSRTNKTIAVTADESVSVDPDVAIITFAYNSYGSTKDEAYNDNLKGSESILKAMFDAGVPKAAIETGTVSMERPDIEEKWTLDQRKQRQFSASQSWKVKIPVTEAQKLVDIVMRAGANDLGPVHTQ